MALFLGKLVGRNRLIEVSPKKTWEGFVGSSIFTILIAFVMSNQLCKYEYMICPVEYQIVESKPYVMPCNRSHLFKQLKHTINVLGESYSINVYPFQYHAVIISIYISLIGPFGGFFASGLKRALGLKDFSTILPGHGGFNDRFDCTLFASPFISFYIETFIKSRKPLQLYNRFLAMNSTHRAHFLELIDTNSLI